MLKKFLFLPIGLFSLGTMATSVAMEQRGGRNPYGYPNMGHTQQNFYGTPGNQYQQGYPYVNQVPSFQYNSSYPTPPSWLFWNSREMTSRILLEPQ